MSEKIGYVDWDKVVEDSDRQFAQIEATRKNMIIAEQIQKKIKSFAIIERRKYPKPAEEKKEKPASVD